MRIEAYTQVQQLYNRTKATQAPRTQKAGATTDKVQISSAGKDYQVAKAAVAGAPDIREEIVAPIKERIQNGTYEVSSEKLAEKLYQRFYEMR